MKVLGFNHLSIGAKDLEESSRFYQAVLGMELIPTYNFGFKTKYLRCGNLQLHLFELEDSIPVYQHFALDVDDFHAVYEKAKTLGVLDAKAFRNPVNELPDGCVQMYLRDPAGNLVEVDWPDVTTLDRSRIPEMKLLSEFATQDDEGLKASLYLDRPHMKPDLAKKSAPKERMMSGTIHKLDLDRRASGQDAAYAEMLERAHALVPNLRERAAVTEEMRRLPPETERELHEAGLFRILQPKRVGGSEFDYVALVDFADVIALADASVAWNLVNLASHHWMLGMFDKRAQDLIWNEDVNALIASSFVFPAGRARKVAGGYTLSGRWPFSSGVNSSTWNMLAGIVSSDDDADGVEYRVFLLKQDDYRIIDTWNSTGLKGTGSNDVEAKDVFVPDHMTLAVRDVAGGPTPGSTVNPSALYALPVFALFAFVLSGVGLGNAQACLEDYVDIAKHRASTYNRAKLGDLQTTQIKIAEASAKIDAARMIMRRTCIDAMADARRGYIPKLPEKTRCRRDGAFSVNLCTEAVSLLFAASGARGLYTKGALQRQFRDAHAINAHIAFSFDAAGTNYGRVALDLPSENLTL